MGKIDEIGSLPATEFYHGVTVLNELRNRVGLMVDVLIAETTVLRYPEVHETIL